MVEQALPLLVHLMPLLNRAVQGEEQVVHGRLDEMVQELQVKVMQVEMALLTKVVAVVVALEPLDKAPQAEVLLKPELAEMV